MKKYAGSRKRLEEEKLRLEQELTDLKPEDPSAAEWREGSPFGKREEEAAEAIKLETRIAQEKRLVVQLRAVERALGKLEDGTYGRCDECGGEIAPERLEIRPQASFCITCKAARDKEGRSKAPR